MSNFPEPPDRPQDANALPGSGKRARGLESIPVFDAAESVTVEIEILKESYDEIMRLVQENEWEPDEGMRTVLLSGLGYQDAKLRLEKLSEAAAGGNDALVKRVDSLANDLAAYH